MAAPRALSLALLAGAASAQWDTLCAGATGGPYSVWNETRCPSATATCCASGFNPSGVGCCPFKDAVCCPGSQFACCPAGTKCVLAAGSGYDARYNCTAVPSGAVTINKATCKGGAPLPMSTTQKNGARRALTRSCCRPAPALSHRAASPPRSSLDRRLALARHDPARRGQPL